MRPFRTLPYALRKATIVASVVLVFLWEGIALAAWAPGRFEIYLFDVGQADSQLIVSPTGKTLLIDLGETNWNGSGNAVSVAGKIRQVMGSSFSHLDYVVATHLHTDHIGTAGFGSTTGYGGVWNLLEKQGFSVGKLIDRDAGLWVDRNGDGICDPNSEIEWRNVGTLSGTARKWLCYVTDPANADKLHREVAAPGSTSQIDLGPGVIVRIVGSDAKGAKQTDGVTPVSGNHATDALPPSENDYSVTLKITYGDFIYVTGGDTDGEYATSTHAPKYVYNDVESVIGPSIGRADVIKVNHHGSAHSSNQTYIDALQPTVSMISCGKGNSYGHPDQSTLNRLLAIGKVYLTERCAPNRKYGSSVIVNDDIVISTTDGKVYTVNGALFSASSSPPLADTSAPAVTAFKVTVTSSAFTSKRVKVTSFIAADADSPISGYMITETPSQPAASATGWSARRPTNYTIKSTSTRAIYGWAKDAAGNVSAGRKADVWFEQ